MHAISADHRISLDHHAVAEMQINAAGLLLKKFQLHAPMHDVLRHHIGNGRMQIAAMQELIRRAELLHHRCPQRQFAARFAAVPFAAQGKIRLEGNAQQPLFNPQQAQHLHRIRRHLDTGADSGKLRRLFIHIHGMPGTAQQRGSRQTANAGADDGNREGIHKILN